jgi:predicted anti-sigma-YlaC factor YlaD
VPQHRVDQHLDRCAACRDWAEAAAEVTRRARLVAAPPVPDVTAAVLGRLPAQVPRPRRRRLDAGLRLALLAVGAGQLAVGLPVLAGGAAGMAAPVHLAHETGAWNLGLAVCFLVVAVAPRLAAGALPFLLSFAAVLSWVTLGDLVAGHVPAGRAVEHLLLLGGALLVSALAVRGRAPRGGPLGAVRRRPVRTTVRRRTGPAGTATRTVAADGWPRDATAEAGAGRAA